MATKSESAEIAVLQTQMSSVQKDVVEIKTDVKGLVESIDKKYASKWVERVAAGLIGIILTAFLGVLIALVFRHPTPEATSVTRTTTITVNPNGTTTKEVADSNGDHSETTTPSTPDEKPGTTTTIEETPLPSSSLIGGLLNGLGL